MTADGARAASAAGYAPDGMYAWDFWIVEREGEYHLFHLQAPRSLRPAARHQHASVGHAVSDDLRSWRTVGTALSAGDPGAWDDQCIWTGSILPHDGRYYFLYTGRKRGDFLIQRIGLAVSDDLYAFEKHPQNPVLLADPRYYQTWRGGPLRLEDWRDPYLCVVKGRIHAFITARTAPPARTSGIRLAAAHARELAAMTAPSWLQGVLFPSGPLAGRGCIARATTDDFVAWTVHPPVLAPASHGMLECPQYLEHDGRSYLLFSTWSGCTSREHARRSGAAQTGLLAFVADGPDGPYRPVNGNGVVLGTASHCYATRLLRDRGGDWKALSWLLKAPGADRFCGRIAEPQAVALEGDRLEVSSLGSANSAASKGR